MRVRVLFLTSGVNAYIGVDGRRPGGVEILDLPDSGAGGNSIWWLYVLGGAKKN
jgi:hypothetical protein